MNVENQTPRAPGEGVHLSGYQARDHEVVDYRMTELPGTGLMFRGPLPPTLEPGGYFAAVGAGQTFGCLCDRPWPDLLAEAIGLPTLNLGYGGAGPEFFLGQEALLPYLNRARFVVLQVMSARSQSNAYYACDGLEYVTIRPGFGDLGGRRIGAKAAFDALLGGAAAPRLPLPAALARPIARRLGRLRARRLVAEMRAGWVAANRRLLERIEVPVVLLWFSERGPAYREDYRNTRELFGAFPQLVTAAMLDAVRPAAGTYVECVSRRGSPQPLVSRFTGQPATIRLADDREDLAAAGTATWSKNRYYPSPEMHEDAARALEPVCAELARAQSGPAR